MDICDETFASIREQREATGKDRNRYQELKAEVQRKLRVDKQQQLEGMCMELEAANSNGNSRQLFQHSKVPAMSTMYPVSDWQKFDSTQIPDR